MTSFKSELNVLEYLQQGVGCAFLSDLCDHGYYWELKDFLRRCNYEAYTLEQWQYAYRYIFDTNDTFETREELQMHFLQKLSGHIV